MDSQITCNGGADSGGEVRCTDLLAHIVVNQIPAKEAEPWLLARHYAKRMCPISYAFGAWRGAILVGVVTYGTRDKPRRAAMTPNEKLSD